MRRAAAAALLACSVAPAGAVDHFGAVVGFTWEPASLSISEDDTVTFQASPSHPLVGDAGTFGCDSQCTLRFAPGVHAYHCGNHGAPGGLGMSGQITVAVGPPLFADGFEG